MPVSLPPALLASPAGRRAAWVLQQAVAIAAGAPPPGAPELAVQYTQVWLSEVPAAVLLSAAAARVTRAIDVRTEPSSRREARVLLTARDGSMTRFRCVVDDTEHHRIAFQLFSPAVDPSSYVERYVRRAGRSVRVQDFGGDGPFLLLWHGAGCDASVWEAMTPYLRSFHVVAQDLPGHGGSVIDRFSIADTVADGEAVVAELGLGEPYLVGHSMGGWAAMHFAAITSCRALVCLDGPTSLDYASMSLSAGHHAFVPDPPDVAADIRSIRCPAMVVLCRGGGDDVERQRVAFRTGLAHHLAVRNGAVRVEWQDSPHMLVLSHPEETAALIVQFLVPVP